MSSGGSPLSTSYILLSGCHMDLSHNRPGSSWPDKLHSQRPFPSLGKKVCILFSLTTVTNTSRGVVRLASLWTTLKPKTTPRNVYILHPCFPYFYLHNLGHTWESAQQQRKRQNLGLRFEANNDVLKVLLERETSAKTILDLHFMISHFYYIRHSVTSTTFIQCEADSNMMSSQI